MMSVPESFEQEPGIRRIYSQALFQLCTLVLHVHFSENYTVWNPTLIQTLGTTRFYISGLS